LYAFFQVSAHVVRPAPKSAFRYPKLACHPAVLRDFVTTIVDVIVKNQLALVRLQEPETLQ
jgi:hypothetical protein